MTDKLNWFDPYLAKWATPFASVLGSKPTPAMLKAAAGFCGHGTAGKQCFALAMAMRKSGVTAPEVQVACGAPQNNFRRGLIDQGLVKVVETPKNGTHTVYRIELTPKGEKWLADKASQPAKGAPTGKKATKVAKPASKRASKPRKANKGQAVTVAPAMPTSEQANGAAAAEIMAAADSQI
jgi:hypothetical protein